MKENYEELTITDDFMFAKIMLNESLCKKLLEVILDIRIEKIEYPEEQKVIDIARDSKGVRLDVYVMDGRNTVYNVEMQTSNTKNLPKRSRYYQGMIDLNLIRKGEAYDKLNKSYVIFICTFDMFGKGRHIYTFENLCLQDADIRLGDDTTKVFLNPYSDMDDVDEELGNFLKYIAEGTVSDRLTQDLSDEVGKARKNEEWRLEYMTLYMREQEARAEGRAEGRAEERNRMIEECLRAGKTPEQISEFLNISVDEIKLVEESLLVTN